jgi:competence protein ComEC
VLQVSAGDSHVLLPGDIEERAEQSLLARMPRSPIALVVVPHHGSRTSSKAAFVGAVRADIAVVSAGFDNRWGLPKDDIAARWQDAGAVLVNTATSGAVGRQLCIDGRQSTLQLQRALGRRYWQAAH